MFSDQYKYLKRLLYTGFVASLTCVFAGHRRPKTRHREYSRHTRRICVCWNAPLIAQSDFAPDSAGHWEVNK